MGNPFEQMPGRKQEWKTCPICSGTGMNPDGGACGRCNGEGKVSDG